MALDYDELMAASVAKLDHRYSEVETLLYAQSVGLGRDPVDSRELPFVYEDGLVLQTLPSMATVLVPDLIPADLGWNYSQVLHAEQRLTLHRPLPSAAELTISKRVIDVSSLECGRHLLKPQFRRRCAGDTSRRSTS